MKKLNFVLGALIATVMTAAYCSRPAALMQAHQEILRAMKATCDDQKGLLSISRDARIVCIVE